MLRLSLATVPALNTIWAGAFASPSIPARSLRTTTAISPQSSPGGLLSHPAVPTRGSKTGLRPLNASSDLDGKVSIDALKKEAEELMIPSEEQLDYIAAQIVAEAEHRLQLAKIEAEIRLEQEKKHAEIRLEQEKKHAEIRLELEKKDAEIRLCLKHKDEENRLELEHKRAENRMKLEHKDAEIRLELEHKDAENRLHQKLRHTEQKMQYTETGLLSKLRIPTQRHALQRFLFECWGRMENISEDEIEQIRLQNKQFPKFPEDVTEPDMILLQEVLRLNIPVCNDICQDILGGGRFPRLDRSVSLGVLSTSRVYHTDPETAMKELFVADDDGDDVIKFFETLAERYGYKMTLLNWYDRVFYEEEVKKGRF